MVKQPAKKKKTPAKTKAPSKTGAAARKAAGAAATGAARAVKGPSKPNPALSKFAVLVGKDAKLRARLMAAKTADAFHAMTVKEGAKLGLHFTTADSRWRVADSHKLAATGKHPVSAFMSLWDQMHDLA